VGSRQVKKPSMKSPETKQVEGMTEAPRGLRIQGFRAKGRPFVTGLR
jgi:hypothetical protein